MNREIRLVLGLLGLLAFAACSDKGSVVLGDGQGTTTDTTDFGIAYIKRIVPPDPADLDVMRNKDDLRHYRRYWSKADVYLRQQAEASGAEFNITARVTGADFYDIKDLDVSADGKFLVFAMRGPLQDNQRDFNPPNWRIWEYDIAKDDLHSITDDVTASEGQDVSPHYLPSDSAHPNGRILIASTRQRDSKLVLLTEGKSAFEAQSEDPRISLHAQRPGSHPDGTERLQADLLQSQPRHQPDGAQRRAHPLHPLVAQAGAADQRFSPVHGQPRRHQR
jgi:hypothetical protein